MSDSSVQITFGADASAVTSAAADAKDAVTSVQASVKDLATALSELQGKSKTALTGLSGADDHGKTKSDLATRLGIWSQYQNDLVKLNADSLNTQDRDQQKALAQFQRDWNATINPLVSKFGAGLLQMAEGTRSFAQVMRGIGQQILQDFVTNVVDKKIEAWLWGEVANTSATGAQALIRRGLMSVEALFGVTTAKAKGAADISTSAAEAFAAAWASTAAIPIIGPALAPAAATSAYAGAMSANGLLAAAGGFDVPSNLNPITQLHANEMVLPARLANPLRDMLANYWPGRGDAPTVAGGGDTHNHYYNINAMDGPSFRGFLRGNTDHLSTVLQEMGRRGQKTG